jgi:hypothetical protein
MSARDNPEIDPDRTRLEQMENTKRLLQIEVANLSKALGHTGEVTAPQSALEALTRTIKVLDDLGAQVGRHSIRSVRSVFQPGNVSKPDSVRVTLDMTFFADSATRATENLEAFTKGLQAKPWVTTVSSRGSKALEEGTLEEGETGIFVDGLEVLCDMSKVERNRPQPAAEAGQ